MALDVERERERDLRSGRESQIGNLAAYRQPILALLRGRPVKLLATGDMPGRSPACHYVDETGRLDWEDADKFTVIDPNFLPPSESTLRDVLRTIAR